MDLFWAEFLKTGQIKDYLKYKRREKQISFPTSHTERMEAYGSHKI